MTARNSFLWCLITALIAVLFILSSCVTEKKRLEICKSCTLKSERSDSTIVSVSERTVPVVIPGPTVTMVIPNPCDLLCDSLGNLKAGVDFTVPAKGGKGRIRTTGDNLTIECLADSLKAVIKAKDTTIKRLVTIQDQEPARCELEHLGKWDSFFIRSGQVGWLLFILAVVGWVIKKRFLG
jgi:hypothetical protein